MTNYEKNAFSPIFMLIILNNIVRRNICASRVCENYTIADFIDSSSSRCKRLK